MDNENIFTDPKVVIALLKLKGIKITSAIKTLILFCPGEYIRSYPYRNTGTFPWYHTKYKIKNNALYGISKEKPRWHRILNF